MSKKGWDGKFDKDTLMEASAGVMGFKKEANDNKETGIVLAGYTSVSIKNVNDDSAYDFVDDVIDEMKKKMLKAEKKWDIKMLGYDEPTFNEHDEGEDWWAIKVFFKPNSPDVDIDALVDKINYVGVIQSVDQAEDGESYSFKFESIATEVKEEAPDLTKAGDGSEGNHRNYNIGRKIDAQTPAFEEELKKLVQKYEAFMDTETFNQ